MEAIKELFPSTPTPKYTLSNRIALVCILNTAQILVSEKNIVWILNTTLKYFFNLENIVIKKYVTMEIYKKKKNVHIHNY